MCGTHACIARDRRVSKMEGRLSSAYVNDLLIFRLLLQLLKNPDSGNGGLPPGPIHFACFDSRSAPISVRLIFSLSLKIHLRIGNFVCCRRNLCSSNRRRPCYLCEPHARIDRDCCVDTRNGPYGSDPLRLILDRTAIWLILPVVICLSQRLSHACLSTALVR